MGPGSRSGLTSKRPRVEGFPSRSSFSAKRESYRLNRNKCFRHYPFSSISEKKYFGSIMIILISMLPKLAYSKFSINPSSAASVIHRGNSISQFLVTLLSR